jgi:hypothetical protein
MEDDSIKELTTFRYGECQSNCTNLRGNKMRHERWLSVCLRIVNRSPSTTYKHVSLLVRGGSLLAYAYNRNDRPGKLTYNPYDLKGWHSELSVLYKFSPADVKGATLYTVGITPGGNLTESCPCPICQDLIRQYCLKAVYYFDRDMGVRQLQIAG